MNFPHDDPLYLGAYWNEPVHNPALAEADVVLVVDSDVPWIPMVNAPSPQAAVFHIDVDPLKASIPLWYLKARRSIRADAALALGQLRAALSGLDRARVSERRAHYGAAHQWRIVALERREAPDLKGLTAEYLTACVRRAIGDDAIVLNEGITNYTAVADHVAPRRPGSFFASGGSSLGWSGGAAIGMKLAAPQRLVVALTGDGSYMFSQPSTVHWMARRYATPFLQVVYNNGGWQAPRFSALAVHPNGFAARAADLDLSFAPAPDYAGIAAAAGGALAIRIERTEEAEAAIARAVKAVRDDNVSVVVDARLAGA